MSEFVGRIQELCELHADLDEAIAGRGRLLLLAGEPGIGKTRLAEELSAHARQRDALVLWGRCWEGGGAPAYWPWVQIIRGYARTRPDAKLEAELGACAPFVAHLVPELGDRLQGRTSVPPTASEEARFALLDALTEFLRRASAAAPLVLVLDDLHAADAGSLLLMQFLAPELPATPILLVGTLRDVGAAPAADVAAALRELMPAARHIRLRGLPVEDVARLVDGGGGAAAVHAATGGNPLFVLQVTQLQANAGSAAGVPLPPGVREAIVARVRLLPERAAATLALAAVVGEEPAVPLLRTVSGLDIESLLGDLGSATSAGLLVEQAGGRLRFAHGLIREALYDTLEPAARRALHRDVGQGLECLSAAEHGTHLAALANHFCRAGDVEVGVGYAVRAAERAMALLAYEEAAAYYTLALSTLDLSPGGRSTGRYDILLGLGAAERRAGRAERSRAGFEAAAVLATELDDPERLARAALGLGTVEPGASGFDERLVVLLERALAALPDTDDALRARVLARLAREFYVSDAPERAAEVCRRAVQLARRTGDSGVLIEVLCAEHLVTWGPDNLHDRLRSASEIVGLAEAIDDRDAAMQARIWRMSHLLELGDVRALDNELAVFERMARELRQPGYLRQAAQVRAGRAVLRGRFEKGELLAREALTIGSPGAGSIAEVKFLYQLRIVCAELGRLDEIAPQFERFGELYPAWRVDPLYHLTRMGRRGEARVLFEQVATDGFGDLPRDKYWLWNLAYLAEAAVFLGDAPRAARLYELLLPYGDVCLVIGQAAGCEGALARHLGGLAALLERWDDVERHFERALEIHRRLGSRPLLAHTEHEYAGALLRRGRAQDQARAATLLADARTTADELGMTVLAARLQVPSESPRVFRKEGEYWTIAFEGSSFRLKDERGLAYIARLLAHPHQQVHVLELAGGKATPAQATAGDSELTSRLGLGDAGELLDAEAKAAYRQRLVDLREELDEAQRWGDPERAARAADEIDALTHELARAVGLGGRDRTAASPAERARVSATKAIKRASAKIARHDERLGEHLELAIRTGTFCSYTPAGTSAWET